MPRGGHNSTALRFRVMEAGPGSIGYKNSNKNVQDTNWKLDQKEFHWAAALPAPPRIRSSQMWESLWPESPNFRYRV
jgi:hypothetical protein